jgi:ribosomal-protein-alanine N-acetyltransferase
VLRTDRLILREWRETDRAPFAALNADPEVMEHFVAPLSRAESDAFADRIEARMSANGYGLWAVEVIGGAPFVGYVGLSMGDFDAPFMPAMEIGWRLARDAWGHGYATEAATVALEFAFSTLDRDEVDSWTAKTNLRSQAVMRRIGMRRDLAYDFEHPRVPVGHPIRPHVLYRLPRRYWVEYRATTGDREEG